MASALTAKIILDNGETQTETTLFQLTQWKHAMKLEEKGLRHSRGSVTAHVKRVLGLPPRCKRNDVIQTLEHNINLIKGEFS